jgi:CBS domain-containing protein
MSALEVQSLMSRRVETLSPEEDLDLADMIMRLEKFRHLPVAVEGRIVGILSERDLLRAQASSLKALSRKEQRAENLQIKVREAMTRNVVTVAPHTTALEAAQIMRERRIGCLPVVDENGVVGIITESDLLDHVIHVLSDPSI